MGLAEQLDDEFMRARLVLLGMLAALSFLGVALWRAQVVNTLKYTTSLDRQSMRRVRLPAIRGTIQDRNGVPLAVNRPSYCIAVYAEELRLPGRASRTVDEIERVLDGLAGVIGRPREVTREDIEKHIQIRRPLPLLAWRNIDNRVLARWAESRVSFPGVDVAIEPVREYPRGALAAHVLGYVGRLDPVLDGTFHYYLPEMEGKTGVERTLNERLSGQAGGRLIRVDASGFRYAEEGIRAAVPGEDVRLTIDADIQEVLEKVLEGERGAGVVIDPRNGDILALASSPAFSPESIRSVEAFGALGSDPSKPLYNRAIAGVYPPGSTFKPVVAIAALENRRATGDTEFACPGYYMVGKRRIDCWSRRGHGRIGMRKAIEQSCNSYFCQLGLQCGYVRVYHMAEAIGFGYRTEVELPGEARGLLPGDAWKRKAYNGDGWRDGDTCNVSIGQGALLVTPVQMAVFAAALANGGRVWRPRLVMRRDGSTAGELANEMGWSPATMAVVRGGMHDVVQAENGTGKRARIPGIEMAGKTGSAEYGPPSDRKKHAWMILFAPYREPRYAAALVIEDGVSGGITTAPRMREIMKSIFGVRDTEPEQQETGSL